MLFLRPEYKSSNIIALWNSKIPDLATLKEHLPGSVLVSLDIEAYDSHGQQDVSEVGLAVLRVPGQSPPHHPNLYRYYADSGVEALTIRLRDRKFKFKNKDRFDDPEQFYGVKVYASEEDVGDIVARMLSKYKEKKVLVGFGMNAEFRWMSEKCTVLAESFEAWVDMQELVCHRRKEEGLGENTPGLTTTLKELHFSNRRGGSGHNAASDAIRTLAVLSGLVSHAPMTESPPGRRGIQKFWKLPKPKSIHPFSVQVTTEDGGRLPKLSPQSLMELFEKYEGLKGVAVNWRTQQQKTEGVKFWWAEFHTRESLERFVLDIDGSTINNTRLCVVRECK
jgi:hypothetical protein